MRILVLRIGFAACAMATAGEAMAQPSPSETGDLVITEFMSKLTAVPDYNGQWIEVYNASGKKLALDGVAFASPGQAGFSVTGPYFVDADDYFVLGVSADMDETSSEYNGSVPVDYVYDWDLFRMDYTGDTVTVSYGTVTLDTITWNSSEWGIQRDATYQANLNAYNLEWANDLPQNWCTSDAFIPYSPSMKGTPGAANEWCDSSNRDTDGDGYTPTSGDCDDEDIYVNGMSIDGDTSPYGNPNDDADCDGIRDDGVTDDDMDGYAEVDGDCNDADDDMFPAGWEGSSDAMADGKDNDCNCFIDDLDYDNDGFSDYVNSDYESASGDPPTHVLAEYSASPGCEDPRYQVPIVYPDCNNLGTDPNAADQYPGATEVPYDGIDQDCNGFDMCDVDGDGYDAESCPDGDDCNDNNAQVHPSASEGSAPDGVDQDCNGVVDDPFQDQDGDGYTLLDGDCLDDPTDPRSSTVYPGARDLCDDLLDNDCDGLYNDGCSSLTRYATIQGGGCGTVPRGSAAAGIAALLASLLLAFHQRRR